MKIFNNLFTAYNYNHTFYRNFHKIMLEYHKKIISKIFQIVID